MTRTFCCTGIRKKKIKIETPVRKLQREKIKVCNELTKASNLSSFPDSPPYLAIVTVESGTGNWPSGDGFSSIALKLQTSPLSAHSSLPRMNAFPELIPIIRQ